MVSVNVQLWCLHTYEYSTVSSSQIAFSFKHVIQHGEPCNGVESGISGGGGLPSAGDNFSISFDVCL